ncbi:MAG: dihydroorotate dehydrogenase [Acidimicrobiia bacterium]
MPWTGIRRRASADGAVDLSVEFLGATLASPIVTASGTFGHGAELAELGDPAVLGAVTTKSVSLEAWKGNLAPRVAPMGTGMINAVGLQNGGVSDWIEHDLPKLRTVDARVIASIWGHRVQDFAGVAAALEACSADLFAIEINASCPNLEDRSHVFAHDPHTLASVVSSVVTEIAGWGKPLPVLTKLSPNVTDIRPMVEAAMAAGSSGVTMINTVMGLGINPRTRKPILGKGGGGLSGPPIHAIALRLVRDVHEAFPEVPILGVGGVSSGEDAFSMLLAGATAVGVGTASFADPRAPWRIRKELQAFCSEVNVTAIRGISGALVWPQ